MTHILLACIGAYRKANRALVSVGFPLTAWSGCRQWPTCSEYATDAIHEYGVGRGVYLAFIRMLHCHPLRLTH